MIRIVLHMLILSAMLWVERRSVTHLTPRQATFWWFLLGVPLMLLEAFDAEVSRGWLFVQSLLTAVFFLPAVYVAFRLAGTRGRMWLPLLAYLALSIVAGLLAGLVLAHTPFAFGKL